SVVGFILSIMLSIYYFIWNIAQGVRVLKAL
ncbi:DUF4870 domain-containing protein, partial [Bacillus cereus]